MKVVLSFFLIVIFWTACSVPSVPQWKKDAHAYVEQYKYARLSLSDKEAERYKRKAIQSVKHSMNIDYLQIIELSDAAMSSVLLKDANLSDFKRLQSLESLPSNNSYMAMLSHTLTSKDIAYLPDVYHPTMKALLSGNDEMALAEALMIRNPISRLIALSVLANEDKMKSNVYEAMLVTARSNGYRNVILAVAPKLVQHYRQSGEDEKREKMELLIREMNP